MRDAVSRAGLLGLSLKAARGESEAAAEEAPAEPEVLRGRKPEDEEE